MLNTKIGRQSLFYEIQQVIFIFLLLPKDYKLEILDQERFRSLTQTHYKKAQCAFIAFDVYNLESFYNLPKWYSDVFKYCNNQKNFAVLLIGFKRTAKDESTLVSEDMIENFQVAFDKIIDYCFIDLSTRKNLKEPYEILLNYLTDESRCKSSASLNYNNYIANSRTPMTPALNLDQIQEYDSGSETISILNSNNSKENEEKGKCCCCCSIS